MVLEMTYPQLERAISPTHDIKLFAGRSNPALAQEIADYLGTSQTMYARYERGANELPIHHLIKLCDFYGVSADYFLGRNQNKS